MYWPEPPRPVGIEVEISVADRDELGEGPSDTARAAETVEREAGGHVQAGHSRHRPDQRVGVRCHGVRMADQFHDPRVMQEWETAGRAREKWLRMRLGWRPGRPRAGPLDPPGPAPHPGRPLTPPEQADSLCP